jgi:hypothetical protein
LRPTADDRASRRVHRTLTIRASAIFDLLEFRLGLGALDHGRRKLSLELLDRGQEIVAPLDRGLGEGRIREMRNVADAASLLLRDHLIVEILRHPLELGDHRLDLRDLAALFAHLETLQADQPIPRLHDQHTPPQTSLEGGLISALRAG